MTDTSTASTNGATATVTVKTPSPPRLPSWIGLYIVTLSFAMFAAMMFAPPGAEVSEAARTQIITIIQSVLVGYVGWQFGAAHATAQRRDDTVVKTDPPKPGG